MHAVARSGAASSALCRQVVRSLLGGCAGGGKRAYAVEPYGSAKSAVALRDPNAAAAFVSIPQHCAGNPVNTLHGNLPAIPTPAAAGEVEEDALDGSSGICVNRSLSRPSGWRSDPDGPHGGGGGMGRTSRRESGAGRARFLLCRVVVMVQGTSTEPLL